MRGLFGSAILTILLAVSGCDGRQGFPTSAGAQDYDQAYREQLERNGQAIERAEEQYKRSEQLLDRQQEHSARMDKILTKWEEQARRYDAILDRLEKQTSPQNLKR